MTPFDGMKVVEIIESLDLAPHPEGGYYRETLRLANPEGDRGLMTAIHFLLPAGKRSHWHRVDAAELWLWQGGAPLSLEMAAADDGPVEKRALGSGLSAGQELQALVPAGTWQAAESLGDWSLVACIVAPAFQFEGFTLAPADWSPSPKPA